MSYKDRGQSNEAARERMRRYRAKGVTGGVTNQGVTEQGVTQYPALLYALVDPIKKAKLRRICESLKNHGVLKDVSYGIGGPGFDIVSEYLEVL